MCIGLIPVIIYLHKMLIHRLLAEPGDGGLYEINMS